MMIIVFLDHIKNKEEIDSLKLESFKIMNKQKETIYKYFKN